jgi:hypothetical protein
VANGRGGIPIPQFVLRSSAPLSDDLLMPLPWEHLRQRQPHVLGASHASTTALPPTWTGIAGWGRVGPRRLPQGEGLGQDLRRGDLILAAIAAVAAGGALIPGAQVDDRLVPARSHRGTVKIPVTPGQEAGGACRRRFDAYVLSLKTLWPNTGHKYFLLPVFPCLWWRAMARPAPHAPDFISQSWIGLITPRRSASCRAASVRTTACYRG